MIKYFKLANWYIKYLYKKAPLLAGFKLTHKCNLKCKHCPFWKIKKKELDFYGICNTIDKLSQYGAEIIIFEGGEPTLWKDSNGFTFVDVLNYARKKFLSVNFTTNGLNGFYFPADTIWVSIDGLSNSHNQIRGENVFETVIEYLREIQPFIGGKHPKIFANICINSINYREIPALILYLKKFVQGITIQFYYPYNNDFKYFLNNNQRVWVLNRLIELKKFYNVPLIDSIASLRDLKYNSWNCHPEALINAEPDGTINIGCYIKNRGEINCKYCGFAAHVELSKAIDLKISSIITGLKSFL